jgi:hypothetical protein
VFQTGDEKMAIVKEGKIALDLFECEEIHGEEGEDQEAAIELLEKIGMEGQLSMVKEIEGERKRQNFREMTADERFVFEVLCPQKIKLEDYKRCPVPLRVLRRIQEAVASGMFEKIEIWDKTDQSVKDPVVVGITSVPGSSWNKTYHPIARWGAELDEMPAMIKDSVRIVRERLAGQAASAECKARAFREEVKLMSAEQVMAKGAGSSVSLYGV